MSNFHSDLSLKLPQWEVQNDLRGGGGVRTSSSKSGLATYTNEVNGTCRAPNRSRHHAAIFIVYSVDNRTLLLQIINQRERFLAFKHKFYTIFFAKYLDKTKSTKLLYKNAWKWLSDGLNFKIVTGRRHRIPLGEVLYLRHHIVA